MNVPGHPKLEYSGTAFIVGENLFITNRHVAETFSQTGGDRLVFTPGIAPSVDLKQEVGETASMVIKVTEPVLFLTDWDAALFRVASLPAAVKPLRFSGAPPPDTSQRLAIVVGYPFLDSSTSTDLILQQIQTFHSVFGKKRLQPGRIIGMRQIKSYGRNVEALAHDCTTLGGNSGSALIDIDSETVIGLHFAGEYLIANYAVPSWELSGQQILRKEGVLFM